MTKVEEEFVEDFFYNRLKLLQVCGDIDKVVKQPVDKLRGSKDSDLKLSQQGAQDGGHIQLHAQQGQGLHQVWRGDRCAWVHYFR